MQTHRKNLELVTTAPEADGRGLSVEDAEAARELAESHREIAARLPPGSPLRGLVLRSGGHWSRLAGLPKGFFIR